MILEIINPSDAITLETDDPIAAGVGIMLISRGAYGLKKEDGEIVFPLFIFGGAEDWLKKNGVPDLDKYIYSNNIKMADALDSVIYGGFSTRELVKSAMSKMKSEDAAAYLAEWNDRKRSSLNNIGKVCFAYAKKLRSLEAK